MKKLLTTFLLLGSLPLLAQHFAIADKRLAMESDSIDYWYMRYREDYNDTIAYGRFEFFSESFETDLLRVLNTSGSIDYDFKELGQRITITASPDKKLRAFSWDSYMGGTMKDFRCIFQFKTAKGQLTKVFGNDEERPDDPYNEPEILMCLGIFQVETKNGTLYIPHTFMTESSLYYFEAVKFLKIEGEALNYANVLSLDGDLVHEHGVEYISHYIYQENSGEIIEYDPKKRILSFVQTDDKQNVTNGVDRYKFNGKFFEKVK